MSDKGTLGDAIDLRRTRLVVIHDVWVGYNHHSPAAALYELRRGPRGDLSGDGLLSTAVAGERVVNVNIPPAATSRFLTAIASARVVPGPYVAFRDHTDDYPHIEIALHVDVGDIGERSGIALLFTESQGRFNAPWGACVGGKMFSLPGGAVGRALATLREPLNRATLVRMLKETGPRRESSPRWPTTE